MRQVYFDVIERIPIVAEHVWLIMAIARWQVFVPNQSISPDYSTYLEKHWGIFYLLSNKIIVHLTCNPWSSATWRSSFCFFNKYQPHSPHWNAKYISDCGRWVYLMAIFLILLYSLTDKYCLGAIRKHAQRVKVSISLALYLVSKNGNVYR